MSAVGKQWRIPDTSGPPALADEPPVINALLTARGITTVDAATAFLNPDVGDQTHDPMLMPDMDRAVQRITRAIAHGEIICVYGDFDTDGVTAVALLTSALTQAGATIQPYIPDRHHEGYGLNVRALEILATQGVHLIITVDCGIANHIEADAAVALGMDMIISDHHTPSAALPRALAVINPKRADCSYPCTQLAGVGIAYKIIEACAQAGLTGLPALASLHDLVAVGTITDRADMRGENRALVASGMQVLQHAPRTGLHALIEASGIMAEHVTSIDVAFALGPRINAAGRLGSAQLALDLLLCRDPHEARLLAIQLDAVNTARRALIPPAEAHAIITAAQSRVDQDRIVVVACEGIPHGIIGLVATRLVEHWGRPVLLMERGADRARGSARSIAGFDIYAAMHGCRSLFDSFGGHAGAAGFSLANTNINALRTHLQQVAVDQALEAIAPELRIDAEVPLADVGWELYNQIERFAPFGQNNDPPLLLARNVEAIRPTACGKGHTTLQCRITDTALDAAGDAPLRAVAWKLGHLAEPLRAHPAIDILFQLRPNTWNGATTLQLQIVDFRRHRPTATTTP